MARKPHIAIVGAGNLGAALAMALHRAGYSVEAVITRSNPESRRRAQRLAKEVGSRAVGSLGNPVRADVVWLCVPDSEIAHVARVLANKIEWKRRVALHSSGALSSDELAPLRKQGAAIASAHPLMTFVRGSRPSLAGVPFAIEGDRKAVRVAHAMVTNMGGHAYPIRKRDKVAYHAWGMFASPLFDALLATTERVAAMAGVPPRAARQRMIPILLQTLANYASFDTAGAFSGPIVRGDVDTVKRHLRVLRKSPTALEVYAALARAALGYLPAKEKSSLKTLLDSRTIRRATRK